MKAQIVVWSITSALAGFLFGFDTVVISGAEQKIQALWGLAPGEHGVAIAAALYGTVVGSLVGGWPDRSVRPSADAPRDRRAVSRRGVMSPFATNVVEFAVARAIGGLGIGISTVAAPLISPKSRPRRTAAGSRVSFSSTSSSASSSRFSRTRCWRQSASRRGDGCLALSRFRRCSTRHCA